MLASVHSLPQLNSVWSIIWDLLLNKEAKDGQEFWVQVWNTCVENSLFSSTATVDQQTLGLLIAQQLFNKILSMEERTKNLPLMFTPSLMRTFIKSLSDSSLPHHNISQSFRHDLMTASENIPSSAAVILFSLVKANSNFDKITKTATVKNLMKRMNNDDLESYIREIVSSFSSPLDTATESVNTHRIWAVDQLCSIIKNSQFSKDLIDVALVFLLFHSFFKTDIKIAAPKSKKRKSKGLAVEKSVIPANICTAVSVVVSEKVRDVLQTRFFALLHDVIIFSKTGTEKTDSDPESPISARIEYLSKVHSYYTELSNLGWNPIVDVEPDELQARLDMIELVSSSAGSKNNNESAASAIKSNRSDALKLLLLLIGLVQWTEPEAALDLLEDVRSIHDATVLDTATELRSQKKSKKDKSAIQPKEPEHIAVLIDVILSLIIRPTQIYRDVCNLVFSAFCPDLNEVAMNDMLAVLNKTQENEEKDGGEEKEVEEDEEVEDKIGLKESNDSDEDDENSSSDKKDDNSDESANSDEEIQLTSLESLLNSDLTQEISAIQSSHIDEYDHHLSAIINQRKSTKKKGDDEKQQLEHFQLRVLELIEIYLKRHELSPLSLNLYLPLLRFFDINKRSSDSTLRDRVFGIIRKSLCKFKSSKLDSDETESTSKGESKQIDLNKVHDSMNEIMNLATKASHPKLLTLCSLSLISLTKVSNSPSHVTFVSNLYKSPLISYLTQRRSKLNINFFVDIINRFAYISWPWVSDLANVARIPTPNEDATPKPRKSLKKAAIQKI